MKKIHLEITKKVCVILCDIFINYLFNYLFNINNLIYYLYK